MSQPRSPSGQNTGTSLAGRSAPGSPAHREKQAADLGVMAVSLGPDALPPSVQVQAPNGRACSLPSQSAEPSQEVMGSQGHTDSSPEGLGLMETLQQTPCIPPLTTGSLTHVPTAMASRQAAMTPTPPPWGNDFSDLKMQLAAIPTKHDMEGYIQRLETVYKSELQTLTTNLSQVSDQVQRIEGEMGTVSAHQVVQDRAIAQNTEHIHMLFAIAEDHENRNRRNNLRVRGIPETVSTPHILPTLKKLFNDLLGDPETSQIEIDRAHRTLGPKNPDPNRSRDILCRLHYFTVKELILRKAREKGDILLDGCKVQLLSDLSKMTLDKRRALRPLLDVLRERDITYSWGYPFQLQVRIDGTLLCVRRPADIPDFCTALQIPVVSVRDWPFTPLPPQRLPLRPQQRRRGRSPASPQGRIQDDRPDRR